ncbi:MAG: protein-disulfide reductase DsbD domain-containing protein [Xanthobacteraceae bacterium]
MTQLRLTLAAALLVGFAAMPLAAVAMSSAARAQDASDWTTQLHTAARLIAGDAAKTSAAPIIRAGIEIKLDPGWHTYWRDPGDTGVPPTFDFSGSTNVKSTAVEWPAPESFPDGAGGTSIGYVDHVILPLRVTPQHPEKQSVLHLKLGYAVCGNLCIPVEANLQLALDGNGAENAAIRKAEIRVPRHAAVGLNSRPANGLAITAVHLEPGQPHDRVVVDLTAPAQTPVQLFVEGPTPDWSLPQPQSAGGDGTTRHFSFDLDGLPPDAQAKGATLTFTAVSADDAIEVPARLD